MTVNIYIYSKLSGKRFKIWITEAKVQLCTMFTPNGHNLQFALIGAYYYLNGKLCSAFWKDAVPVTAVHVQKTFNGSACIREKVCFLCHEMVCMKWSAVFCPEFMYVLMKEEVWVRSLDGLFVLAVFYPAGLETLLPTCWSLILGGSFSFNSVWLDNNYIIRK